jgi:hypothetical protein
MLRWIALAVIAVVAASSPSKAATPTPLPTLTPVPLVNLEPKYDHLKNYAGDFTFDQTDYGRGGGKQHEHVTVTLHFDGSYRDAGNLGPELQWSGYAKDAVGNSEESEQGCSGSGTSSEQAPTLLLARLFVDLGRGTYWLNTYGIQFRCSSGNPIVGGFSATYELPAYNSVICGTMHLVSPDDFDQTDTWSFRPTFDNHTQSVAPTSGCPQVSPPPSEG